MPGNKKSYTVTEIKAGIFVVISAVAFVLLIAALLRYEPATQGDEYHANFNGISGLSIGDVVRFGGMQVGRVIRLDHDSNDQSLIRVSFRVDGGTPVNADSEVYITQLSIASNYHLEVTTGAPDAPLLESGAEIPTTRGGLFGQLEAATESINGLVSDLRLVLGVSDGEGIELMPADDRRSLMNLMNRMDGLMADFRVLVGVRGPDGELTIDPEKQTTIANFLDKLRELGDTSGNLIGEMNGVITDNRDALDSILETGADLAVRANELVIELQDALADNRPALESTLTSAEAALADMQGLAERLNDLTLSLQATIDDNRPEIDALLRDTRRMVQSASELVDTLNQQPQSLVRGRQPIGRQE